MFRSHYPRNILSGRQIFPHFLIKLLDKMQKLVQKLQKSEIFFLMAENGLLLWKYGKHAIVSKCSRDLLATFYDSKSFFSLRLIFFYRYMHFVEF